MGIMLNFSETAEQLACVVVCGRSVRVCDSILDTTFCSNVSDC